MRRFSRTIQWSEPESAFIAFIPAIPELSATGPSQEIALHNLELLECAWLDEHPDSDLPASDVHSEFSGQFRLRIPRQLHRALAALAASENVSLNTMIISLLSRAAGTDMFVERFSARVNRNLQNLATRLYLPQDTDLALHYRPDILAKHEQPMRLSEGNPTTITVTATECTYETQSSPE